MHIIIPPIEDIVTLTEVPGIIPSATPTVNGVTNKGVWSLISPIVMTAVPVLARKSSGASRAYDIMDTIYRTHSKLAI